VTARHPVQAGGAPRGAAAAAPGAPAVEVRELTKRFGDFVAVDGVSFAVASGEVFGFLGPNGAGKTTTIKMLNGLLAPSSGSGRVAGFDIATERTRIKSSIGYMSQLFSLYGDLTVDENIGFFAGLYGVGGARLAARRSACGRRTCAAAAACAPAGLLLGRPVARSVSCAICRASACGTAPCASPAVTVRAAVRARAAGAAAGRSRAHAHPRSGDPGELALGLDQGPGGPATDPDAAPGAIRPGRPRRVDGGRPPGALG